MSEQTWALLVGFGTVVGLRLLDWLFPRGYFWKKVQEWSVRADRNGDSNE